MPGGTGYEPANQNDRSVVLNNHARIKEIIIWLLTYFQVAKEHHEPIDSLFVESLLGNFVHFIESSHDELVGSFFYAEVEIHPLDSLLQWVWHKTQIIGNPEYSLATNEQQARNLIRDFERRNAVPLELPEQPEAPAEKDAVRLEEISDEDLLAEVERRKRLKPAFSALSPPTIAPRLWADNIEGLPATAFVAKYYSSWIEAGVLSLKAIRACDPDLANAYRNRVSRYPSEAVALVRSTRSDRIDDPQEAIDRVRDAARESAARRRAALRSDPKNAPG